MTRKARSPLRRSVWKKHYFSFFEFISSNSQQAEAMLAGVAKPRSVVWESVAKGRKTKQVGQKGGLGIGKISWLLLASSWPVFARLPFLSLLPILDGMLTQADY